MAFAVFAESLIAAAQHLSKADQRRRDRLATLVEAIADCITSVHTLLTGDAGPTAIREKCAELDAYAEHSYPVLAELFGAETAKRLEIDLASAILAREVSWAAEPEYRSKILEDAAYTAGELRAFAKLLKASAPMGRPNSLKAWWKRLLGDALDSG